MKKGKSFRDFARKELFSRWSVGALRVTIFAADATLGHVRRARCPDHSGEF
jgi:hypothetical protein